MPQASSRSRDAAIGRNSLLPKGNREQGRNALAASTSPYLLSAAAQPVHWQPWGDEAFALARRLDKPVYLDIGAIWCHWCHVMDRESYEDPEVAAVINEHYVPIKVDRDLRPDIDQRYQRAVAALTGASGWPLTAFLTPSGDVLYGATYVPAAQVLNRLYDLTQEERYRQYAGEMIAPFAGRMPRAGISTAALAIAVQQYLQ